MLGEWTYKPARCLSVAAVHCRLSSTFETLKGAHLGPIRADTRQTFRIRKDGTSKELPLPPTLDPVILEKQALWKHPKDRPKISDLSPFQKKLWENPFAHALASPLRQCRTTSILLPDVLLVTLHIRPHPTTKDPWLLPMALTTSKKHLGFPYRFLNRQLMAAQLGKKRAWEKGLASRMIEKYGARAIENLIWREDMPDLILRVLQTRLVKKLRWNFGFTGRLIPVLSPLTEHIENIDDVSCVIHFESLRTRADEMQQRLQEIKGALEQWSEYFSKNFTAKLDPHSAPGITHKSPFWYKGPVVPRLQPRLQYPELEFTSTVWRGKKVAVYSLTDLLGEEKARDLIVGSKYEQAKCVVLKGARHNVPVEILLMQLQSYIAQPGI